MNTLNNRNKRTAIFKAAAFIFITAVMSAFMVACDDEINVQQSYPFTVETMPVPGRIAKGETVEIRCELKKAGDYKNTLYTIRFFQFEGTGTLKTENGIVFKPNDRYLLENEKFRLYYTSGCEDTQNFIVVVEDNERQSFEMEFDFNNSDKENGNAESTEDGKGGVA